jgi:hypothetical protein
MRFGTTSSRFRLAHNDEHDKEIKETVAPRISSDVALEPLTTPCTTKTAGAPGSRVPRGVLSKTKTAPMIAVLRAHKRVITLLLVAWVCFLAFWLILNSREGPGQACETTT